MKIKLPGDNGALETYRLQGEPIPVRKPRSAFNRVAFAAANLGRRSPAGSGLRVCKAGACG